MPEDGVMPTDGAPPAAMPESAQASTSVDKPAITTVEKVVATAASDRDHHEPNGASHEGPITAPHDDKSKATHDGDKGPGRPQFSTSTEKEIRDLMNSARRVQTKAEPNIGEDARQMASLTTCLVQLMNAEYIVRSFYLI
jgi:hypothetical protein